MPPASAGDTRVAGSIPGSGRFPGVGNIDPCQYYFLENSMDRGARQSAVQWVAKSWMWLKEWTGMHWKTCGRRGVANPNNLIL